MEIFAKYFMYFILLMQWSSFGLVLGRLGQERKGKYEILDMAIHLIMAILFSIALMYIRF